MAGGGTGVGIYYGVTNAKNETEKKPVVENGSNSLEAQLQEGRADSASSRSTNSDGGTGTQEIQS